MSVNVSYIVYMDSRVYITATAPRLAFCPDRSAALLMTQQTARAVAGTLIQSGHRATVIEVEK